MLIKLLPLLLATAQPTELAMPRIMELVGPVLKTDIQSDQVKIPEKMIRTGRLSVPMPALLLFFNETGCLTAIVGPDELSKADGQCFGGERVPHLADFIGSAGDSGLDAVVILSPLYNLAALKSVNSSRDAFWDARRADLDRLQGEIEQKYPDTTLHPVYVPFGM